MDIDLLSVKLIQALRGERSQEWLARRLNTSKTQIHRWEKGKNDMRWDKFCELCNIKKINLRPAFKEVSGQSIRGLDISTFVLTLIEGRRMADLQIRTGISKNTLYRWIKNESMPSLNNILKIIYHARKYLFINFISYIVPPSELGILNEIAEKKATELSLTYREPEAPAVLFSLMTKKYQDQLEHESGLIAELINISETQVERILEELLRVGLVEFKEHKYKPVNEHNQTKRGIDTRGKFRGNITQLVHWLKRCHDFVSVLSNPPDMSRFGYNVFTVSKESYDRIQSLYFKFYEDVRIIIDTDLSEQEGVLVLGVQLFSPSKKELLSGMKSE